jgi:choline-sulfatase
MSKIRNVVLIISDQHRRDAAGCYGNPVVKTPNLDRLSAEGVRFTQAYCDSPLCVPSRCSLITGRFPHRHGATMHRMGEYNAGHPKSFSVSSESTLGQIFRDGDFDTAAIGKMHVFGETRECDLGFTTRAHRFYTYSGEDYANAIGRERADQYVAWGPRPGLDEVQFGLQGEPTPLVEDYLQDTLTTDASIGFLRGEAVRIRDSKRPFMIHVGLERPHTPFQTLKRYHDLYDSDKMPLPETRNEWWQIEGDKPFPFWPNQGYLWGERPQPTDREVQNGIASYYANVSEVDHNVGRVLDALDESRLRDETLVIYTTDHGEMLFDHGLVQKQCFYEGAAGIPLIVSGPGIARGETCAQRCSLIDMIPTFCALFERPLPADADGISLLPALHGQVDLDRAVFCEYHSSDGWGGHGRMIRTREYKYIYYAEPKETELLFSVAYDPAEVDNLAGRSEYKYLCDKLRAQVLDGWMYAKPSIWGK